MTGWLLRQLCQIAVARASSRAGTRAYRPTGLRAPCSSSVSWPSRCRRLLRTAGRGPSCRSGRVRPCGRDGSVGRPVPPGRTLRRVGRRSPCRPGSPGLGVPGGVGLQQRLGDLTLSDLRVGQTPDDGHPLGGGDQVEPDSSEEAAHARGAGTIVSAAALTSADQETARVPAARDRVVSLTERRLVDARGGRTAEVILPADGRPLPSVATYDELLAHPSAAGTRGAS